MLFQGSKFKTVLDWLLQDFPNWLVPSALCTEISITPEYEYSTPPPPINALATALAMTNPFLTTQDFLL